MSSDGANASMDTSAPLIDAIVDNAVPVQQMLPQIIHILCLVVSLYQIFNIEVKALRWPEIWKLILYCIALSDWRQLYRMSG